MRLFRFLLFWNLTLGLGPLALLGAGLWSCGPALNADKDVYESAPYNSNPQIPSEGGSLKIVIFDVGQGDAALVISPRGEAALIDVGPVGAWNSQIRPYLDSSSDIELTYLFISHGDSDHAGSLVESGLSPTTVNVGDVLRLDGDVALHILAKDCLFLDGYSVECGGADDNAHSMVVLLEYGSFRYLTTGDLPGGGGNPPYDTIDLESHAGKVAGDVDILHVGHHGSNTSTNQTLLDLVAPEIAVISVGNNNDYWHPHQSVIERLLDAGIKVYQTERGWLKDEFMERVLVKGDSVTIESDGTSYKIY